MLWIKTDDIEINVNAIDMTATITFRDGIALPDGYNFSYTSTPDELNAVGEYIWKLYGDIIGYDKPQLFINGGDYSIDGDQSYDLRFYDRQKNIIDNFENYSFSYTEFSPNSDGELWMIRIFSDMALEKIGLYTLINEEEALELLLNGEYYSNVMEEFPGEEAVVRSELIYRAGSKDKIMMPFYRFYVYLENAPRSPLLPEKMKIYGAYYVPALDPVYLEK